MGGSLGGLNAALWLLNAGCEVDVFERTPVWMADRGTGIVLNPATIRYFRDHRTLDLDELSASANQFRYLNPDGSTAFVEPSHYRFTAYSVLYRGSLDSLPPARYHRGEECVGFKHCTNGVTVRFTGERTEQCDLLVFADGINSIGRRLLLPEIHPGYAGYVAWRGTVREDMLSAESFNISDAAVNYAVLPDSHALSYPIPNTDGSVEAGHRLINWLWYRNVTSDLELDALLTGSEGTRFKTSVPPGLVPEDAIRQLRAEAAALPPSFREMIDLTDSPFIQVVFDLEVPRMAFGQICLIGDAAFTARPHAAAGTAKAAEDGWQLGEAMKAAKGDVLQALRRWEPGQLALGQHLVGRSREAGSRLQTGRWRAGEPLSFGLYEAGDSSFRE